MPYNLRMVSLGATRSHRKPSLSSTWNCLTSAMSARACAAAILFAFSDSERKVIALAKAPEKHTPGAWIRAFYRSRSLYPYCSAITCLDSSSSPLSVEDLGKASAAQSKSKEKRRVKARTREMLTESSPPSRKALETAPRDHWP